MTEAEQLTPVHEGADLIHGCIAMLTQHKKLYALTMLLTVAAAIMLLYMSITDAISLPWLLVLVGIVVVGIIGLVYAIRVGFDLSLLRKLELEKNNLDLGLAAIDRALIEFGLIASSQAGRPIGLRVKGCLRLFKIQIGLCFMQLSIILVAAVVNFFIS